MKKIEARRGDFSDRIVGLRRVKASELAPHPQNWRNHRQGQRDGLRGVLEEIGWVDGLMARELDDGSLQLIDGHLRKELAEDAAVPVLVVDLDDDEARAVLATFDPLSELAGRSEKILAELVASVDVRNIKLAEILDRIAPLPPPDSVAEITPPDELRSEVGMIWRLGNHRLAVGDSRDGHLVKRLFGRRRAAAILTDPPYQIGYTGSRRGAKFKSGKDWSQVFKDLERKDVDIALSLGLDRVASKAAVYEWHADSQFHELRASWDGLGLHWSENSYWIKRAGTPTRKAYMMATEPVAFGWPKGRQPEIRDATYTTAWQFDFADGKRAGDHPTRKPLGCYSVPMIVHTARGDWVYDPFAGSGTVILAAEKLERRALAVEREPQFADLTVSRWEEITGKKAKVEAGHGRS